jgi:hypothetical protein
MPVGEERPSFPPAFDIRVTFGPDGSLSGRFGTGVLDEMIAGIDEFQEAVTARPSRHSLGAAMLGAFAWLDDDRLLECIASYPYACVTFTKQPRPFPPHKLTRLQEVLDRGRGFPAAALRGLETLMPLDDLGQPQLVGPYSPQLNHMFSPLRTLGHRKVGGMLVPLLHAKLMLLGELTWMEDEEFGLDDITRFQPRKLWIGSANGTFSSRFNLEIGCWQTQTELLSSAQDFLVQILANSEDLDPDANTMKPGQAEPDYDDAAMAEASALLDDDDYDW